MDTDLLQKAGLTESQAKGYIALVEHGSLTAKEIGDYTNESRNNAYAIADRLVVYGLATKSSKDRAAQYTANHPSSIERLAETRRKALTKNEMQIKDNIGQMLDFYYKHQEKPGARIIQGAEGIKKVYDDTLDNSEEIYLVRTPADESTISAEYFEDYAKKRAAKKIHTIGFYPKAKNPVAYLKEGGSKDLLIDPIEIEENDYTSPVEINVYGNKVAFISYGKTQMATIIQSPTIALAMKQILKLLAKERKIKK